MSEFTESEIRSKERRLQEVGKKITACMEKEKTFYAELSRLRKELTSKSSFSRPEQIQRNITDQERRLEEILREHERYERERESLSGELDRLRQSLEWKASFHRSEERRKQAREKTKKEVSHIAAFSAGAIMGAKPSKSKVSPKKTEKQKGGVLQTVGPWLLLFLLIGGMASLASQRNMNHEKEESPLATVEATQPPDGMAKWIGASVKEIYAQYGETDQTSYISGGSYFYYEDQAACPYEFFYEENGDEITQEDLIYGVGTGVEGTLVIGNIQIGGSLQQVEETMGASLRPETMEGSDFYPCLGAEVQIDELQYWLYFSPESKNLVYAMVIKKE